jgi:hypothetical protein
MTPEQIKTYFSGMHVATLPASGRYLVWHVNPDGSHGTKWLNLKKGMKVFMDGKGRVALKLNCGNPMVDQTVAHRVIETPRVAVAPPKPVEETFVPTPPVEVAVVPPPAVEVPEVTAAPPPEVVPVAAVPPPIVAAPPVQVARGGGAGFPWPLLLLGGGLLGGGGGGGGGGTTPPPVPEPSSMLALGVGAAMVMARRRKR